MKLSNGVISVVISNHGAELKSAIKDGFEYLWCADAKYWPRTSPVLFPIVGSLNNKSCRIGGGIYEMGQHGFARDNEFCLIESTETSATYEFCSNEETLKKYPYKFSLKIRYTLVENTIKIQWIVENRDEKEIYFQIGAHPAFNLKGEECYFKFDSTKDIEYNLINEAGLYNKDDAHVLKNDGFVRITNEMFDNDALIVENRQAKEVCICTADKKPYVKVSFTAPLFGLWSPAKKNAPFVCIEPWYGRCDRIGFDGEFSQKEYMNCIDKNEIFTAEYEIELV